MIDCVDITMMIIISTFMLLVLVLFGVVIYYNHKHRKRLEEIMIYQINTNAIIDRSIPAILDLIIDESFTDYQVKYLAPLEEGFINSEREIEIRKELVHIVTNRISSAALDKISLFYNIGNIADILSDKIYIVVMKYVADHNAVLIK